VTQNRNPRGVNKDQQSLFSEVELIQDTGINTDIFLIPFTQQCGPGKIRVIICQQVGAAQPRPDSRFHCSRVKDVGFTIDNGKIFL
jgi:hypothetical protein